MAQKNDLGLPPHPGLALVARYRVFGIASALLACCAFALGAPLPAVGLALFSAVTLWVALYSGPQFKAVQINNFAYDHMTRGDLDGAERILARAGEAARAGLIARAIASQRAAIALQRGDSASTVRHATTALAVSPSIISPVSDAMFVAGAHALRAMGHAIGRDAEACSADVARVRDSEAATPSALAHATLATCILHANANDKTTLARELDAAPRLLEHLAPRQRGLARALRRMAAPQRRSVYRQPAVVERDAAPTLEAWVHGVVPEAAAFVPATHHKERTSLPPLSANVAAPAPVRAKPPVDRERRRAGKIIALGILIAALFFVVFQWVDEPEPSQGRSADASFFATSSLIPIGAALLFVLLLGITFKMQSRRTQRFANAERLLARGEDELALKELDAMMKTPAAGAVHFARGAYFERKANLAHALSECDLGLAIVNASRAQRVGALDLLLPGLVAERAFVLAALGRPDECNAELAHLVKDFPGFAYMARSRLRAEVMKAVNAGDLERARALARERAPELPLPYYDDVLCDALLALESDSPAEEASRVLDEVDADAELRHWLEVLAPSVLAPLRIRRHGPTPTEVAAVADADEEAAGAELKRLY